MNDEQQIEQGLRLAKFLKQEKLTQVALSQRIGISQGFINKVLKGEKGISGRVIKQVAEKFPEVNLAWLLKGEGEMLRVEKGAAAAGEHHFPDVAKMMVEEPAAGYVGGGVLERLAARVSELEKRVAELEARESKQP